jgi:hypothetical protein
MANTTVANSIAILMCDAAVDTLDGGSIEIYGGTQPTNPDASTGETVLATVTLPSPAFGNATDAAPGATATANSISTVTASATGTATWFRAKDSGGTARIDGDVSGTGGGGDMQLDNTSIQSGGDVSITSWTVTHAEM